MNNINELKQRLQAVKETKQITNAMYLLSTAKMRQVMQSVDYNLTYLRRLRATMKDIIANTRRSAIHGHFIDTPSGGRPLFLVITADKGMCGGYNSAIVNLAIEKMQSHEKPLLYSFGTIGGRMLEARGIHPDYSAVDTLQQPSFHMAREAQELLTDLYNSGEASEIYIIYTEYLSSAVQRPVCRRLLPLIYEDFDDVSRETEYTAEMLYEPSVEEVFEKAVPQYIIGLMYDIFMQSVASENAARMNAMQSATKNADEMIAKLQKEINAQRQLSITNEITEIAAATEISGAV